MEIFYNTSRERCDNLMSQCVFIYKHLFDTIQLIKIFNKHILLCKIYSYTEINIVSIVVFLLFNNGNYIKFIYNIYIIK